MAPTGPTTPLTSQRACSRNAVGDVEMSAAAIAFIASAAAMSNSYGESLLDAMHWRHPEISSSQILVATREGVPITIDRQWSNRSKAVVTQPLLDANGNGIGTVIFHSRCP